VEPGVEPFELPVMPAGRAEPGQAADEVPVGRRFGEELKLAEEVAGSVGVAQR
jgi:hypothetical protein